MIHLAIKIEKGDSPHPHDMCGVQEVGIVFSREVLMVAAIFHSIRRINTNTPGLFGG